MIASHGLENAGEGLVKLASKCTRNQYAIMKRFSNRKLHMTSTKPRTNKRPKGLTPVGRGLG